MERRPHMPTHTDQHFDMYVFQHVDGPGLQRRRMALIRLTKMQNNETLAGRGRPPRAEGQRDVTLQNADGDHFVFCLFFFHAFISFQLHEYSATLEDVRGGFVSRHMCGSLQMLAVVVTGLWRL